MLSRQRISLGLLSALMVLVLGAGLAVAQTAQTIVIDGVNDFLPGNMIEEDFMDVNIPDHADLDISNIHVTNDAVNLYVGFTKSLTPFGGTQFGIAIDVGTAEGGIIDPWRRMLEWSSAANKPDFIFYVNLDNGWQSGYSWDGTDFVDMADPGPNSLGWVTNTDFAELSIMLGALGLSSGSQINVEVWLTQEGDTKGPLDAASNDGSQLSLPGVTVWDVPSHIPMITYLPYTVLAAADPDPPTVVQVQPTSFPAESFFDVFLTTP